MELEFSGPRAINSGGTAENTATLRRLLTTDQRPAAIARALDGAGATEWRDRGGMMMAAGAYERAYQDYATASGLDRTDRDDRDDRNDGNDRPDRWHGADGQHGPPGNDRAAGPRRPPDNDDDQGTTGPPTSPGGPLVHQRPGGPPTPYRPAGSLGPAGTFGAEGRTPATARCAPAGVRLKATPTRCGAEAGPSSGPVYGVAPARRRGRSRFRSAPMASGARPLGRGWTSGGVSDAPAPSPREAPATATAA
jgi:hypothetical protein